MRRAPVTIALLALIGPGAPNVRAEEPPLAPAACDPLGRREFAWEIPEEISYRRYPFVRIVEEAREKRWFTDLGPYASALEALVRCHEHAKRLASDEAYASLDVARRGIDQDEHLRPYNYDAAFASPYLICYSTKDRIDEAAMWTLAPAERAAAWTELDRRRAAYKPVLAEKARIYSQIYERFLSTYGEACDLRPLMDPYGGRPDYPAGKRSYREGCPLVVWVFADREAWDAHHDAVRGNPIPSSVVGYVWPHDARVFVVDRGQADRGEEVDTNARLAVRQLLHWFGRQRNEWGRSYVPDQYFLSGFADWFGSVRMTRQRAMTFGAVSHARLARLRQLRDGLSSQNRKLPVFPLRELTSFEGIGSVQAWGVQSWGISPGLVADLFALQSWAFFHFLDEFDGGRRRPIIEKLLVAVLDYPRDLEGYLAAKTQALLGIDGADGWKALDKAFEGFYDALGKRPLPDYVPPSLADWPGYVAPELEAPTGPTR